MNKTVTANLGGWVFHIEEKAYEILKAYLQSLRNHFKKMDGGDEIVADIEIRIAEIFKERLQDNREVIINDDVQFIIGEMGKPEDFEDFETEETDYSYETSANRKLYRDKENGIFGGVASGIAAYFDISTFWVRLFFIICTWFGMSILIYVLLWMLIPAANTMQQKMEMRGEPFNLDNLEKNLKDEFNDVKQSVQEFAKDKHWAQKLGNGIERFFVSVANGVAFLFKGIFKFFFLMFGITILILVFSATFHLFESSLLSLIFQGSWWFQFASVGLLCLSIGVSITIIISILRWVFGIGKEPSQNGRFVRNGFIALIFFGILLMLLTGSKALFNFNEESQIVRSYPITEAQDTLYIGKINEYDIDEQNFKVISGEKFNINQSYNSFFEDVRLDVIASRNKEVNVSYVVESYGASPSSARKNAKNVEYPIYRRDSLILFSDRFSLNEKESWNNQSIKASIRIPVGQTVYLAPEAAEIFYDIKNIHDMYDADMMGQFWKMTERGLVCLDCDSSLLDNEHHIYIEDDEHSVKIQIN